MTTAELLGDAPEGWVAPQTVCKLQRIGLHRGQRIARAKLRDQEERELEAEFDDGPNSPTGGSMSMPMSSR